jgi:hypothetical protein
MEPTKKIPIIREDDGELLGYIAKESSGYTAQTIFGFILARTEDKASAEMIVRNEGLLVLKGMWRYYDESERDWYACILSEVFENKVIVIRTNELGYQDPAWHKVVTLKSPDDTMLQKA